MQRNLLVVFIIMAVIASGATSLFILRSKDAKVANLTAQVPVQTISGTPVSNQKIAEAQIPVQNIVAQAQVKDRVVTSIDGSKSLTMKINHGTTGITYSFYTQDNPQSIFTKTVSSKDSMDIPDNSWAPGENYIFIEQTTNGVKDYYVLKTNREAFADGQQFLDVGALFAARNLGYNFNGATGWADQSLLIVETTNLDGSTGPSYWFEMPEGSFIQLSQHQ